MINKILPCIRSEELLLLLGPNRKGGWILKVIPVNNPIQRIILVNPIEAFSRIKDRTTVNRGSVNMIVNASPKGKYCKQEKLK